MQNIPAQITFGEIWALAVALAGQPADNVASEDSILLQTFAAAELEDQWRKEAWPELADEWQQVTLTNKVFSLQLGTANEIGFILGMYPVDPRVTPCWHAFEANKWWIGNGDCYVNTDLCQVWVNYCLPCPDLLDPSLVGPANQAALMAVTLPSRFRIPLAAKMAGHLLATEDPLLSASRTAMGDRYLALQASQLSRPWWLTEVRNH